MSYFISHFLISHENIYNKTILLNILINIIIIVFLGQAILRQSTGVAREPIMLPLRVVNAQQKILQSPLVKNK